MPTVHQHSPDALQILNPNPGNAQHNLTKLGNNGLTQGYPSVSLICILKVAIGNAPRDPTEWHAALHCILGKVFGLPVGFSGFSM